MTNMIARPAGPMLIELQKLNYARTFEWQAYAGQRTVTTISGMTAEDVDYIKTKGSRQPIPRWFSDGTYWRRADIPKMQDGTTSFIPLSLSYNRAHPGTELYKSLAEHYLWPHIPSAKSASHYELTMDVHSRRIVKAKVHREFSIHVPQDLGINASTFNVDMTLRALDMSMMYPDQSSDRPVSLRVSLSYYYNRKERVLAFDVSHAGGESEYTVNEDSISHPDDDPLAQYIVRAGLFSVVEGKWEDAAPASIHQLIDEAVADGLNYTKLYENFTVYYPFIIEDMVNRSKWLSPYRTASNSGIVRGKHHDDYHILRAKNGSPVDTMGMALMYALDAQYRGSAIGMDWGTPAEAAGRLRDEAVEVIDAIHSSPGQYPDDAKAPDEVFDELGDVLFMALSACRYMNVNPAHALSKSTLKVVTRQNDAMAYFKRLGVSYSSVSPELAAEAWALAKYLEKMRATVKGFTPPKTKAQFEHVAKTVPLYHLHLIKDAP